MMTSISVFDIFTLGIGPSSSHTVGPMRAIRNFLLEARKHEIFAKIERVNIELYGSLGSTGRGHGTDSAVIMGLLGETPEQIRPEKIKNRIRKIEEMKEISLLGEKTIAFYTKRDLHFKRKVLPFHPNGIVVQAFDQNKKEIFKRIYYSMGGGFVREEGRAAVGRSDCPFNFQNTKELMQICRDGKFKIYEVVICNELTWNGEFELKKKLDFVWQRMKESIDCGLQKRGVLPGGMNVKRRSFDIYQNLQNKKDSLLKDHLGVLDWVNLYALAVSEENASGGRIVTAPTNGAAGIIPAVLNYYIEFCPSYRKEGIYEFLLTAAAIAILYKKNASISGADVGCQGEVGVACSMAAGALSAVLGGSVEQIENAAEIGMEHNLGLTCDPVGGLVQVPCIERNAMGAIKAINASRIALRGDGSHFVSLDQVIKTMWETGKDMNSRYKETARGGLAVNIIEC